MKDHKEAEAKLNASQRLLDIAARADAEEGIRQGLEDVAQARVRPAREFFAEFEAKHGMGRHAGLSRKS